MAELVDYAGLFPPASRTLPQAVEEYAAHLASPDAWMLGRFVVPVGRLNALATEWRRTSASGAVPWHLSALAGDDPAADAQAIRAFAARHRGALEVDAVEVKADTVEAVARVSRQLDAFATFVELPLDPDPRPLLEAVRREGVSAKMRTGGVTAAAFPTPALVARFLARCAELKIPFKATAGLHHPLRGEQRLTYATDSQHATMFGFINLFFAAALAEAGAGESELAAVLDERRSTAFDFSDEGARWRDHAVSLEQLERTRRTFAASFGSCSFREPVDDLRELALL